MTEIGVETFLGLLIAVAIVAAVVEYVHLPYTVALVLTGLALALVPAVPRITLTPAAILTVFLPVLLFYGAYHLDFPELRANLTIVTLLAIPGVLVTAALVGVALHLATVLTWSQALLLGTIVAATDPVACLAILGEVDEPPRLSTIITAESLFNDGTALVLFTTMLAIITTNNVDVGQSVGKFVVEVVGSITLGAGVGTLGSTILRRVDDALLETTITLIMAYGGYMLASRLGISGPLETVTAGLLLGTLGVTVMSSATRQQAGATWEFLDFVANSLLFLLMGLAVRPIGESVAAHSRISFWWPLVVAIGAVLVSRVIIVGVFGAILPHVAIPLTRPWRIVLVWAGLRGAVSFAAALSLPADIAQRSLLLNLTFGVVLFTLIVQGLTFRPLLDHFHIRGEEALDPHGIEDAR